MQLVIQFIKAHYALIIMDFDRDLKNDPNNIHDQSKKALKNLCHSHGVVNLQQNCKTLD